MRPGFIFLLLCCILGSVIPTPLYLRRLLRKNSPAETAVTHQNFTAPGSPAQNLTARSTSTNLPAGWAYLGCIKDSSTRVLPFAIASTSSMTREKCATMCAGASYGYAGVEYGE